MVLVCIILRLGENFNSISKPDLNYEFDKTRLESGLGSKGHVHKMRCKLEHGVVDYFKKVRMLGMRSFRMI